MAEDEAFETEVEDEEELSEEESEAEYENCADRKPCNRRIDELAMPSKRLLLNTFREYGYLFPKEWNERIKELLSILYAMTPEETEKYFEQLRESSKQMALKRKMQQKLKKLVAKRKKREMKHKAYVMFRNIIKLGLMHAATQDIPPLVSIRLRNLSDIILQQLADLRGVEVPDRQNPDKLGSFLISAADWIAIAVENVYYRVQLKKNEELEEIEEIEMAKLEEQRKNEKTKRKQKDDTVPTKSLGKDDHINSQEFSKGNKITSTPNTSREKIK